MPWLSRSLSPHSMGFGVHRFFLTWMPSREQQCGWHQITSRHFATPRYRYEINRDDKAMPEAAKAYWKPILKSVESPLALELVEQLDLDDVRGIPQPTMKTTPCLEVFTKIKKQYPEKVVLVQIGDFYESVGLDAVLLIDECGLTPMVKDLPPPRAGLPLANLSKTLDQLLNHSKLSVVICNEFDPPSGAKTKTLKIRKITKFYNPGEQGFSEDFDDGIIYHTPSPNVALVWEPSGFKVLEYRMDRFCIYETEHLTEDALWGQLSAKEIAAPLCIHSSFAEQLPEWERAVDRMVAGVSKRIRLLDEEDPVQGFRQFMMMHHGYAKTQEIYIQKQENEKFLRKPSYSTAAQLGLGGLTGIPNILDFLVGPNSPQAVKAWFRDLLSEPKSLKTAAAIQKSLHLISKLDDSLPQLREKPSPGKTSKTLNQEIPSNIDQDNPLVMFYRYIYTTLEDVDTMFSTDALRDISHAVFSVVQEAQQTTVSPSMFHKVCCESAASIEDLIILKNTDDDTVEGLVIHENGNPTALTVEKQCIEDFFALYETFYGIVQDKHIIDDLKDLHVVKGKLSEVVFDSLQKVQSLIKEMNIGPLVALELDKLSRTLFLSCSPTLQEHPDFRTLEAATFKRPTGRKGTSKKYKFYTGKMHDAMTAYNSSCKTITQKIQDLLQKLRKELLKEQKILTSACYFSMTLEALILHSYEAVNKDWKLPNISKALKQDDSAPLIVTDMWPYWMDKSNLRTVKNSITLKKMVMLTGPNMAGKSTVLRSLVAVSLLALSGLYVPVEAMECPYMDNIVLRSFSGDSPYCNQSGFSNEMKEMKIVMGTSTSKSLVLLDELGKGTEVKTGSAIAGSFLESLGKLECKGIFSTHLHLMKKLPLNLKGISFMKMKTKVIQMDQGEDTESSSITKHVPEWLIAQGYNLHSLAIQVALDCGLHDRIISQAYQYEKQLQKHLGKPEILESDGSIHSTTPTTSTVVRTGTQTCPKEESESDVELSSSESENNVQLPKLPMKVVQEPCQTRVAELLLNFCQEKGILGPEDNLVKVGIVKPRHDPPPSTTGRSYVYVYRRTSGHYYGGQTDDLRGRLEAHRRKKVDPPLSRKFETWYICIPKSSGGKSMGRRIERDLILAMKSEGYLMSSEKDAHNRNFGIRE